MNSRNRNAYIIRFLLLILSLIFSFAMLISMSNDYWSNKAVKVNVNTITMNGTKYKWFILSEKDRDTNTIKINNSVYVDNGSSSTEFFNHKNSNDYYEEADSNDTISNSSMIPKNALEEGRVYFQID